MSDPDRGTAADTRPPFQILDPAVPDLGEAIERWFTYHDPRPGQPERYVAIRDAGKVLAQAIAANTPPGADRSAAIRKVREAVMTAIAGIACER